MNHANSYRYILANSRMFDLYALHIIAMIAGNQFDLRAKHH